MRPAVAVEVSRWFIEVIATAERRAELGREPEKQAIACARIALAAPARFRLLCGPRRPTRDSDLAEAKTGAFGTLHARVDWQAAAAGTMTRSLGILMQRHRENSPAEENAITSDRLQITA